jgi:hypothetical protein
MFIALVVAVVGSLGQRVHPVRLHPVRPRLPGQRRYSAAAWAGVAAMAVTIIVIAGLAWTQRRAAPGAEPRTENR